MLLSSVLGIGISLASGTAWAEPGTAGGAHKAAKKHVEVLEPGVTIDWDEGVAEAAGSSAADLHAPSAEVARVKAERLARERARERLKQALLKLPRARFSKHPPKPEELDTALSGAETSDIDYGATGSVSLRLRLKLSALPAGSEVSQPSSRGKSGGAG